MEAIDTNMLTLWPSKVPGWNCHPSRCLMEFGFFLTPPFTRHFKLPPWKPSVSLWLWQSLPHQEGKKWVRRERVGSGPSSPPCPASQPKGFLLMSFGMGVYWRSFDHRTVLLLNTFENHAVFTFVFLLCYEQKICPTFCLLRFHLLALTQVLFPQDFKVLPGS